MAMSSVISPQSVCATVLAGGRATRMGGVDKGLQHYKGQPLAWHAVQRLRLQTPMGPGLIAINANRNLDEYGQWGLPVWNDVLDDFAGPLAGFQTALQHIQQLTHPPDYLLVVPCDSPLFPLNLLERLARAMLEANAEIAMAAIPETDRQGRMVVRAQPVFSLLHTALADDLTQFLAAGGRKITDWTDRHRCVEVRFDAPGDAPGDFANANTLEELQRLEPIELVHGAP